MRFDLTAQQVAALSAMLPDEDDDLRADMMEGETDLYEMASRILGWIEQDEGMVSALEAQINDRKLRLDRFKARVEHKRDLIATLMDIAKLPKLELPEATISKRAGKAKLSIVSDDAVPDDYQATKKSPDKRAINAAFDDAKELPNWLVRLDPTDILTVRRK